MPPTKVYYHGKTLTVGEDAIDGRGVQAIVQDHPAIGAEIVSASDYYVRDDGKWKGVDIFGLFDFLLDHSDDVLFGRMITQEEYHEVMVLAEKDRTGWLRFERKFI